LERPLRDEPWREDMIHLSGWLVSRETPIRSMWVSDGDSAPLQLNRDTRINIARRFAPFPTFGFYGSVLADRQRDGTVELRVTAELQDGRRVPCFTRRVPVVARKRERAGPVLLARSAYRAALAAARRDGPLTIAEWKRQFAHEQRRTMSFRGYRF